MSRTKLDYSKTTIYKICCKDISIREIYIGHTTNIRKRKNCHKSDCNNVKSLKYYSIKYKYIRENGGWDNFDMIEIEKYNAIDANDAKKRERYWVDELKATLNKYIPTRDMKEWRDNNKEKILKQMKEYNENNKEKIKEYYKKYRENKKNIKDLKI